MERISSFDAKTHLSKILSEVMAGKEFVITRHNKDIAKIVPYEDKEKKNVKQAIENIKKFRLRHKLTYAELIEARDEGKR